MRLTLGIVAKYLFSAQVDDTAATVGAPPSPTEILEMFDLLMLPMSGVRRAPASAPRRPPCFRRARRQLDDIVAASSPASAGHSHDPRRSHSPCCLLLAANGAA
ncbi:MAG: hypothetical protein IPP47_33180 [Bryobacterales bacterium]|nr:hypothetical protein [Bryobacterales bacterium]